MSAIPQGRKELTPQARSSTRSGLPVSGLEDRAYRLIRERILAGTLPEGTHLNESRLAESLEMSRTPVRRALGLLLQDGLVEPANGRRLVVRGLEPESLVEIAMIREALELLTVRRAAEVMDLDEIDQLRILLIRQKRAADAADEDTFVDLDEEIHLGIAKGARLPLVHRFLEQLGAFVRLSPIQWNRTKDRLHVVSTEHEKIINAIEKRRPTEAVRLLRAHLLTHDFPREEIQEQRTGVEV